MLYALKSILMTYMRTYRTREQFFSSGTSMCTRLPIPRIRHARQCGTPFLRNFMPFNELLTNKEPFKLVIAALSKMCCAVIWNWLPLSFIAFSSDKCWTYIGRTRAKCHIFASHLVFDVRRTTLRIANDARPSEVNEISDAGLFLQPRQTWCDAALGHRNITA